MLPAGVGPRCLILLLADDYFCLFGRPGFENALSFDNNQNFVKHM